MRVQIAIAIAILGFHVCWTFMDAWAIAAEGISTAEGIPDGSDHWAVAASSSEASSSQAQGASSSAVAPGVARHPVGPQPQPPAQAGERPVKRPRRSTLLAEALAEAGAPQKSRAEQLADARSCIRRQSGRAEAIEQQVAVVAAPCHQRKMPQVPADTIAALKSTGAQPVALGEAWPLQLPFRAFLLHHCPVAPADCSSEEPGIKVAHFYVGGRSGRVMTKAAASEVLGVDERRLESDGCRLANAAVHVDHNVRQLLEALLGQTIADEDLLAYVDGTRSDETPLPVAVPSQSTASQGRVEVHPADAVALQQTALPNFGCSKRNQKTRNKILQSESTWGMLVRAKGVLRMIVGSSLTWLQHLERTTGECLAEADRRREAMTSVAHRFRLRTRLSTLDQARSNDRAERFLMSQRPVTWSRLSFPCMVHITAGAYGKVFDEVSEDISGQIAFALAVNEGAGLALFRKHLRMQVRSKIVILRGEPSKEAVQYRQHLLKLAMARGPRLLQRKAALLCLPNGDWRRRDRIEVWIPARVTDVDEGQIISAVTASLERVLAGCKFTLYPRHRWTKCDEALNEICLLEGVHGLASSTFPSWAQEVSKATSKQAEAAHPGSEAVLDFHAGHSTQAGVMDQGPPDGLTLLADPGFQVAPDLAAGQCFDQARKDNDTHRRMAAEWLATRPLANVLITRQVMEPLRRLLAAQLEISGSHWQHTQRRRASMEPSGLCGRSFPVLEYARGGLTTKFHKEVSMLLGEAALWQPIVPELDRTLAKRGLAFRMLSAAGCWIEEGIAHRSRRFPFQLFLLLDSEAHADRILEQPACLLDPWSRDFVEPHRSEVDGLRGPVPRAKALLVASLAKVDIAEIESWHAAVRRRLVSKGVQTHPLTLAALSSERVCDRVRHDGQLWGHTSKTKLRSRPAAQQPDSQGSCDAKERHCYGGAWRAFIRESSLGTKGRANMKELSKAYRELPSEELDRLKGMGDAARESRQAGAQGSSSFGLTTREVQRQQQQLQKQTAVARFSASEARHADTIGEKCDVAINKALATPARRTVAGIVADARAIVAHAGQASRQSEAEEQQHFAEWLATSGLAEVRKLAELHPDISRLAFALEGEPSALCNAVRMVHPTGSTASLFNAATVSSKRCNVAQGLNLDWDAKHRCIFHKECPPIPQEKQQFAKVPACWELGFCACGPVGALLGLMRRKFHVQMKAAFKLKSLERELLSSKFIVAKLHLTKAEVNDPWALASAHSQGLGSTGIDKAVFWHIGAHTFTPFQSTVRVLKYVKEQVVGGQLEVELSATLYLYVGQGQAMLNQLLAFLCIGG